MLLSQQFCVLLFDLCTASSLLASTGLPELGRQPVPLDFMGKVDTKIREQSSILEKVSRQAGKKLPGRQEEEKPTTEMEGPGGQPAKNLLHTSNSSLQPPHTAQNVAPVCCFYPSSAWEERAHSSAAANPG